MPNMVRRTYLLAAMAACLSLTADGAQAADPADFAAATVVNAADQLDANSDYGFYVSAGETISNVTCDQPKAYPYETTKYQNIFVGSLHQHDTVLGDAHCFTFAHATYTCRLRMEIDYFTRTGLLTGYWSSTGIVQSYPGSALGGVCEAAGVLDTIYPDTHVAVNKPRRVRAYVYTSLTGSAPVARYVSQTYGV